MKDIQLCGIGNGLVDIQYEVSDMEIIEIGLKKGEMLLVESQKQKQVLARFVSRNHHKSSGGSAANTIIAFAQLGGKAAYTTLLGNDDFGRFYAKEFKDMGIILDSQLLDTEPTGTCFVFITPDSERTMHTALGASVKFCRDHIDESVIERAEWLYIEGYKFSQQESADAVIYACELAKKHNTKIAVTFSDVFITEIFRDNLAKVVDMSDLIFCNENEAMSYTKTKTAEEAFVSISSVCPNVVVTMGEKGSVVMYEGTKYDIPSYPTIPVDSTGAGDMFAGAFLFGIINLKNVNQAGHLASVAASKIVSQFGARMKDDINILKAKILKEIV